MLREDQVARFLVDQQSHSFLGLSKLRGKWRQVSRFDSLNEAGNEPESIRTARSGLQDDGRLGLGEALSDELHSLVERVAFAQNPGGHQDNINLGAIETFRGASQ